MNIELKNVGIINNSKVAIDGLTVITGKNSSGKTTVGKVLHSSLSAICDSELAFKISKCMFLITKLIQVNRLLNFDYFYWGNSTNGENYVGEERVLFDLFSVSAYRNFPRDKSDIVLSKCLAILNELIKLLPSLSFEEYKRVINKLRPEVFYPRNEANINGEAFIDRKKQAYAICIDVAKILNKPDVYYNYVKDHIYNYVNEAFYGQIKPVKKPHSQAHISISVEEKKLVEIDVIGKENQRVFWDSTKIFPFTRTIFVDNPLTIDKMNSTHFRSSRFRREEVIEDGDYLVEDSLTSMLVNKEMNNYFDSIEFQERYRVIFEKINEVIPGEVQESEDGFFYVDDGCKLDVHNLATGSKMFSIIKLLIMNGYIDGQTVLVLDEPESHLHPEWVNIFAEILVLLVKHIGTRILLTTHSPNLLLALNVFTKKLDIIKTAHFYLAEKKDAFSEITCIDDKIELGYEHLSVPFIDMTFKNSALHGE